ncbi:MAG: hypothetical protein OXG97_08640 [Candidatus Poribacteria bacterium]|nr:hypothetical protein [Candidatus Poribacteria bacterium]
MKVAKVYLFLIIGTGVLTSGVWFFQRGTTSQETIKVYKTTPIPNLSEGQLPIGVSSDTGLQTQTQGIPHGFHAEDTPHTHAHERPSDFMIKLIKERLNEDPDPKVERWLAYVESEEGRAFFESFPSSDEWYEKSKSFGFFQDTPGILAARHDVYRKYFPTGTVDENEPIIRDMMRDAILKHELHRETEYSRRRNSSVLLEMLIANQKYSAWVSEKFGSQPPSSREWINSTFEEVRLAEREKYFAAEKNEPSARITDWTGSERLEAESEAPPRAPQTPANTGALSEDFLTVEEMLSEDANTQREGIETLVPTVPKSPELPSRQRLESILRDQLSPERFTRAMKTLTQYGPQEGLRRLKSSDPEVAKQVERLLPKPQENN